MIDSTRSIAFLSSGVKDGKDAGKCGRFIRVMSPYASGSEEG